MLHVEGLRNGEWEWLVEFDGNVVLDLHTLGPFLDKYTSKPLLLLDWSYHEDCGDDGFLCFSRELHNMLNSRRKYIEDSKENVEAWSPGWQSDKFQQSSCRFNSPPNKDGFFKALVKLYAIFDNQRQSHNLFVEHVLQ